MIQEVHQGGLRNLEEGTNSAGDALARIREFVTRHATYNAANLVKMTVFFHDFRALSDQRRRQIVEERDLYDEYLRGLIEEGMAEGSIRPDVDPKIAGFWILGAMNWMYQWYRPDGPQPFEVIVGEFADLSVNSLRNPNWQFSG